MQEYMKILLRKLSKMAEFCKDCFLKLFGPVGKNEEIVLSEEPWLCEGCGEWVLIVDVIQKVKE